MTGSRSVTAAFALGGPLDAAFNADTYDEVHDIAIQPDGKILIGGYLYSVRGTLREGIARLNADGTVDIHWKPNLEGWDGDVGTVSSIAIQGDGKVIIGGSLSGVDGLLRTGIARLNADGSLDMDFEPDVGGYDDIGSVTAITLQPDNKIIIGGYFNSVNGVTRQGVARLNADGTLDMDFINPGAPDEAYICHDSPARRQGPHWW